jgi:hypothetical protein
VAVQITGQDSSSLNNVVASLTSQANKVNMSTKLPLPSYSDIQKMTEQEYEDFQNKLQAISYFQYANQIKLTGNTYRDSISCQLAPG